MNEDHKKRGMAHSKFLTALAVSAMLLGSATVQATESASTEARGIQEQLQTRNVKVTVVDQYGPVAGANVIEKGTTNGGITDMNGVVSLDVAQGATLQVSFVGYTMQEVKVTGAAIQVTLKEDTELLDEVVVVGYGQQKKVNLTGAVASVDVGKTIDSRPITDIGRALQGSVPGLTVTTNSGEIGGAPTIKIRGNIGSPNGSGGNPLILVDNVEVTDISMVNPDDIESISVLKDAASASIYGARGAFGVLLITTKSKSKHERLSVKYSNNFSWRTPTQNPEQLPGWQQAQMNLEGEIARSKGNSSFYTMVGNIRVDAEAVEKMKDYWEQYGYGEQFGNDMVLGRDFEFRDGGMFFYRTWDWYDMYVKNWSPQQNHNISINGGNGKTSYNVALSYLNQEGMMKINSDKYKRYNANVSLNSELNKYVSIRTGFMFTRSDYDKPFAYNSTSAELYDPMYYLYRWQPMLPYGTFEGKAFQNALTDLAGAPLNAKEREYMRVTGGVTIKPIKDLTVDVDVTYSTINQRYKEYGTPSLVWGYKTYTAQPNVEALRDSYSNYTGIAAYDYVYQENGRTENLTANFVATYAKRWGDHDFKVMGGSNIEKSEYKYYYAKRKELLDPMKPELNLATGDQTVSASHNWWSVAGFFGRINYNYKDRYMLELNGRYDGSSKFPSGQRFGFFPSMSAGWRASEEAFMQPLKPYLSTLKIRGSWGMIGNQDIGTNRFISTLSTSTDSWIIDGEKTQSTGMPTIVSSELSWEKVTTIDLGFDARFFDDALGVTFDWYNRKTSDILTSANLPWTLGASAPYENTGAIQTKGWELAIDYRHTFENGLHFGVTASISDAQTEVVKWTNNTTMPSYGQTGWWATSAYKEGMILGDIWGLQFDRFLTSADFNADGTLKVMEMDENGNITKEGVPDQTKVFPGGYQFAPGDVLYKDIDGNGKIEEGTQTTAPGDKSIIGNALPRYEFGLNLDAAWKGFDVSMFFQGVAKRNLWAAGNQVLPGFTAGEPYYVGSEDYWREDNQDAFYPRQMVYGQQTTGNYCINDRYLLNMAYVRLKTLTIGYSLPKTFLSKFKVQNLRVYFTGENLFTIDGVKPAIDPEIGIRTASTGRADARNFGRSYPYQKSLSFGIQLSL